MVNHLGKPLIQPMQLLLSPPLTPPSSLPVVRNTATQRRLRHQSHQSQKNLKLHCQASNNSVAQGLEQHRPPTPLPSAKIVSSGDRAEVPQTKSAMVVSINTLNQSPSYAPLFID